MVSTVGGTQWPPIRISALRAGRPGWRRGSSWVVRATAFSGGVERDATLVGSGSGGCQCGIGCAVRAGGECRHVLAWGVAWVARVDAHGAGRGGGRVPGRLCFCRGARGGVGDAAAGWAALVSALLAGGAAMVAGLASVAINAATASPPAWPDWLVWLPWAPVPTTVALIAAGKGSRPSR